MINSLNQTVLKETMNFLPQEAFFAGEADQSIDG